MTNKASRMRAILVALTSVFLFLAGCSTALTGPPRADTPDVTRTNEDIPEGPGLFTGEEGDLVFRRYTGKDKDKNKAGPPATQPTQAQARQLEQQSKQFDQQIEELERQRRELEALKEELKQILKTAPRPQ